MIAPEPMATCPGCGRSLPYEALVQVGDRLLCEPCQEAGVKAEQRRDSLDAAWAAVQVALPHRGLIYDLTYFGFDDWCAFAHVPSGVNWDTVRGDGNTPIRALRALAAKLAEDT